MSEGTPLAWDQLSNNEQRAVLRATLKKMETDAEYRLAILVSGGEGDPLAVIASCSFIEKYGPVVITDLNDASSVRISEIDMGKRT